MTAASNDSLFPSKFSLATLSNYSSFRTRIGNAGDFPMEENMENRTSDPHSTYSILPLQDEGISPSIANSPSIHDSKVKCYMTNITVECVSDAADHPIIAATQMNIEVLSNAAHEGKTLLFNKISSSEWKYDRIIELTDEITFKVFVDDVGRVGSVNLGKIELERFKSTMEPTETVHDIRTEQEDRPMFRLKSTIVSIPLDGDYLEETFTYTLKQDSETVFSMVRDLPNSVINKPMFLDAYEAHFSESFEKSRGKDDIDNCVLANRLMLQRIPDKSTTPFEFAGDPGIILAGGIQSQGEMKTSATDLHPYEDAALNVHRFRMKTMGDVLMNRFGDLGGLGDVVEAISLYRKVIHLTPEDHADMPGYLYHLGHSLHHHFAHTGELTDICEAISFFQKAVQLTPERHPSMPDYIRSLGNSLQSRSSQTGELKDNSEAISLLQKAVKLTLEGHPSRPDCLAALASSLQRRFLHIGELTDISEAISFLHKAVELTPEGRPYRHRLLADLGSSFYQRFLHTGELTDISEAISFLHKAVELTLESHPCRPGYLSGLGYSLQCRFLHTGELTDISESISFLRKAVELSPDGHPYRPAFLADLASSLQQQFSHTGKLTYISEAISFRQKAVELTPEGHPCRPVYLSGLGYSLQRRFLHTGELTDISEAISLLQKAVHLTHESHPVIVHFLSNLALSFSSRFEHSRDITDIHAAISNLSLAANSKSGPPSIRLNAAKNWVKYSQHYYPLQLLDAHQATIHLISRVAGLEQTIEKRHDNLIDISSLSTSAVTFAFASGKMNLALEWFEQGRCLVWSQLNDLRTPFDTLQSRDPKMANDLLRISIALENAGSQTTSSVSIARASMRRKSSIQDEIAAHVRLAQQLDQHLAKVRNIPDFEDFLRPPSSSSLLQNLPNSGIVIVVNIHQDRCDALALRFGIEPLHIPLPEFSYDKAENLRNDLKTRLWAAGIRMRESKPDDPRGMREEGSAHSASLQEILATLWNLVVKPILNGLGYFEAPRDLMRIWWCVSGPLAFLPIHAAGIYGGSKPGIASTLPDFAISSYTPTVRALVDRVKTPRQFDKGKSGLFMISQPDTPHLPRIPGTTEEVRRVEKKLTSRDIEVLRLDSAAATVDRGIAGMKAYSCIHFACHAEQNTKKPLKSGFSLYDGRLELSSIIQQRLVGADLAFLSACQTSAGDEKLSEEAVHLAAGMLAAGYRGAVATMWSICDEYGPIIAEDFYSNLMQDSEHLSGEHAARALHYATQNLRNSLGDSESALLAWLPYVHFGL